MDYETASALFEYEPATGIVTRKVTRRAYRKGERAGWFDTSSGYRRIMFDRKSILEHRLAFLLMTGRHPTGEIDHINRDPRDNRWENLREATHSQNCANSRRKKPGKLKGAYWHRDRKKWQASIRDGTRLRYLGLHETPEEAHAAYVKAGKEIYGAFFTGE